MKRNFKALSLATLALAALSTTSCDPKEVMKVTHIDITSTPDPLVLMPGATGKVEGVALPSNAQAKDREIEWSVEPEGVIDLADDGTVTALALGGAVITATAGEFVTEECPVVVNLAYTGTVSVALGTPMAFTLEDIDVEVTLAEDGTANIELFKVKFAAAMPVSLDVLIKGVTLTKTAEGYSISGDNIVPTAMEGQPFAQYTITDLEGSADLENMSLDMIMGEFPMTFEGSVTTAE